MKRIQSACIMQTIRFSQKDDAGYSVSHMSEMNRAELEKYKMQLEKNEILPMMNAIYNERKKRAEQGKHITSADERAFNSAKHLLHSEISYSLGIAPDMVEQFIEDRINK